MTRVIVLNAEGRREFVLQPHNSIGRHPNNTIQIMDLGVSKEHCHIVLINGRYVLRDLGSLNGTYVNGERVQERVLEPGDEIVVGSTRILFDGEGAIKAGKTVDAAFGVTLTHLPPPPYPSPPSSQSSWVPISTVPISTTPPPAQEAQYHHGAFPPSASPPPPPTQRVSVASFVGVASPSFSPSRFTAPSISTIPAQPSYASNRHLSRVTIAQDMVQSHIQRRLGMQQKFLPESMVMDVATLRRDYEKLRLSYELSRM
ncbi:MAG: FHA domain-containing protein, partial [Sandaracinaceae bacterium]|nr:FHA domain-containing protein [Sandaracinaceae bacterium]